MPTKRSEPQTRTTDASEEFWDALVGPGVYSAVCACGITHYVDADGFDYPLNEPKRLHAANKRDPGQTVFHRHESAIFGGQFDNKFYVRGCSCGLAAKCEETIWRNRHTIARYLAKVAKRLAKEAVSANKLAKQTRPFNLGTESESTALTE